MSESQLVHVNGDDITEHSSDPLVVPEQSMHELETTAEDDSRRTAIIPIPLPSS
uniref:Bm10917 n=1 Tax=Brugia malayi TaxID=6279 RepID=A0A0J9Y1Q2_BRUMA|nr:Bm10917 [Brugia malayi]